MNYVERIDYAEMGFVGSACRICVRPFMLDLEFGRHGWPAPSGFAFDVERNGDWFSVSVGISHPAGVGACGGKRSDKVRGYNSIQHHHVRARDIRIIGLNIGLLYMQLWMTMPLEAVTV